MGKKNYSVAKIQRNGYYFVLPVLALFFLFSIYPIMMAFRISLVKWDILGPKVFVGLDNFRRLFQDQRVFNSLRRTVHFSAFSLVITNGLGLMLALMFTSRVIKGRSFFQAVIFLPVILSATAVSVVWRLMFQATGLISVVFAAVFGKSIPWLASMEIAPYSLIIIHCWKFTGFPMVIFSAGILNVPDTLYEAARIDGAGAFTQFFKITLPFLKNAMVLSLVTGFIGVFGAFGLQYVVTQGGPAQSTEVMALLIYRQAFEFGRFGYATAISIFFFFIVLTVSLLQLRLFKSGAIGE